MAKPFRTLCFSIWLLVVAATSTARLEERLTECQIDRINALEADHRIESEGGITETWNSNHPELKCAGVTLVRRTIHPKGLHLPSYTNFPQLIMILQGEGAVGIPFPGCPNTYEEPQSQMRQRRIRRGSQQQEGDSHQKIRHFKQGDIVVIPPGIPYWTYNYGSERVIAITLLDTTNLANQLDQTPRRFYLAGSPEEEHPETQQEQQEQHKRTAGRRHGQHQQQKEQEEENNNVLNGFSPRFLAQAFGVDEEIASRLQNPREQKDQIIKVEGGLDDIISPKWQEEDEEEERGGGKRVRRGRREEQGDQEEEDEDEEDEQPWWPRRGGRQHGGKGHRQEDEEEDDDEEEEQPWWRQRGRRQHGGRGRRQEEEDEDDEEDEKSWWSQRGRGQQGRRGRRQEEEDEDEEEGEESWRRQHGRGQQGRRGRRQEEEDEDEEEDEESWWHQRGRGQQRRRGRKQEEEEEGQCNKKICNRHASLRQHKKSKNGLEETLCSAKLHENIARPSRADFYNPGAGRISTVNSLTLPILRWFQLSAEHLVLYKNGIYSPHWNINANSVVYAIRGEGRVQMVNCQGKLVFNDVLRRGQILVVPQNFVVAIQAGNEGFESIAFKTNDRAATSPVKQVIRAIPAEVLMNAFGLQERQVSVLKNSGNQSPLVSTDSQYESGGRALAI